MRRDKRISYTTLKPLIDALRLGLGRVGANVRKEIELKVHLAQDEETCLWYIAESDIPGLHLEAESVHELIRKVEDVAPHLIELNVEEILAKRHARLPKRQSQKPAVNILPVFDSPLAVAGC